jgi:hypothetical protein
MEYLKNQNESDFDYIIRLVDGKSNGVYDIDYSELFKLGFNVELASDEARKRYYGLKMILPYIDKEKIKDSTPDKILTELELKKLAIQKEKEKNRTIKIELNKILRQDGRFEMFWDEVKNSIECADVPVFREIKLPNGEIVGLVGISDIHFGKCFESINNKYSMEIAVERLNLLLKEIIEWVQEKNITYLNVLSCGDSLEGLLRISQIRVLQTGVIDSAIQFGRIMVEWLNKLSEYTYVKYHHVKSANHTEVRFLNVSAGQFPDEDLEKVVINYIHDMLQNNPRIEVPIYDGEYAVFEIQGKTIVACHGHQFKGKKAENVIKEIQMLLGIKIDILIIGHLHHEFSSSVGENQLGNIKIIILPSVMGSDHFSDSLFTGAKAGATLIEFKSNKKGLTTHEIVLN